MTFVPDRPPTWQFLDAAQAFFDRKRKLLSSPEGAYLFLEDIVEEPLPILELDIIGANEVSLHDLQDGRLLGLSEVGVELFRNGEPYVTEADRALEVTSNQYVICAGREIQPFIIASEILDDGRVLHQGELHKMRSDGLPLSFLSDDQCKAVLGYLAQIETLLPSTLQ